MAQMDKNSKPTTRLNSDMPAAPGREKREPSDSIQFLPDSREQIEESLERTGLRSQLDEAFEAALPAEPDMPLESVYSIRGLKSNASIDEVKRN
jgi:hypothetical protein